MSSPEVSPPTERAARSPGGAGADTPPTSTFAAFHSRTFTILWAGNLLSNTGSWMQHVAEPWLVLKLSSSPALLGLDSFAGDAPVWILVLLGGLLADRRDRRRTALLLQGLQLAAPLALVALLVTGRVEVWMVIALSAVVGITDALSMPSIAALVPSSVPDERVSSAVALNSAQFNLSRVLGPLAAGALMTAFGAVACFAANAASYVPFLLAIFLLRPAAMAVAERGAEGATLRDAVRGVLDAPPLRRAILTTLMTSVFSAPLITFLPVVVRDELHLGTAAFGGALSAFGVGGLAGAALVLPPRVNERRQVNASLAARGRGALVAVAGVVRWYPALVGVVFFAGAAMVASNTSVNSILQSSIDSGHRGRVASLYTLALRGGAPLGNVATGLLVSRWGGRALVANGLLAIVAHALLASWRRPRPG